MNDQVESLEGQTYAADSGGDSRKSVAHPEIERRGTITPQGDGASCGCGTASGSSQVGEQAIVYVYAIGRIEARFRNLSSEKEFLQATSRTENSGKTDRQTLYGVLSMTENRYLARQMCWVLTVQGLETYILLPRDPRDFDQLVNAIRPEPTPQDLDVVIGLQRGLAPPEFCNGLTLPIVAFDQIYSFDRDSLLKAIPNSDQTAGDQFETAAAEVFDRILQMTDNAGGSDEYRALNYLAMRYQSIYVKAFEKFGADFSLTGLDVNQSLLSSARNIQEVIFSFTSRTTGFTEKFRVRVDVTEEFPFLVTHLAPYFDC